MPFQKASRLFTQSMASNFTVRRATFRWNPDNALSKANARPKAFSSRVVVGRILSDDFPSGTGGGPSLISRQLPPSPMLVFSRRVEHPLDVTVQRLHDADASEHCRPVMFGEEQ
jgi:hypothetical protein